MTIHTGALPETSNSAAPVLPTVEETKEFFAKSLLSQMMKSAKRDEIPEIHVLAHRLREEYPDVSWGILGIYWYHLLIKQIEKALICEQIALGRLKALNLEQKMFYRKCSQIQKTLSASMQLPLLESNPQTDGHALSASCTHEIDILVASEFQNRIDKETDEENKKVLVSLEALKRKKTLYQVNPEVFETLNRLKCEQPNMREATSPPI